MKLPLGTRALALGTVLLLAACGGAPGEDVGSAGQAASTTADLGAGGDFRGDAEAAAAALQEMYDGSTGLFPSTGWWNSANALTALIDYSIATGSKAYEGDVATTFAHNKQANFLNGFYDDEGWWALAWIRAYDLTGTSAYLAMAKTIFQDMIGGWDDTCGGGLWWDKTKTYKNAIPNELFLEVATRLHERTAGDTTFLAWANKEWSWFSASGLINGNDLVNDGLASCKNNGGATWTYNQGVIIGGLVDLADITGDAALLTRAESIATATMGKLVDAHGVLREPCEPTCGGDGTQFKGIFMRHLGELQAKTGNAAERAFLANNADWIWNAGRNADGQVGQTWSGPFDSADASRQSSALDALDGAIPFSVAEANLARSKPATANGACDSAQVAGKAFDGLLTTKWCAGATDGRYWLDVDLGASTSVSRIIVRHAGAGGETPAFDTKAFTLAVSDQADGGAPATVASVTDNTNDVTIHRFAPVNARHVRLDITDAQTQPTVVAARIYELEVYAR
jgi:predicted alpha-1,6-mannanase (GH76 family)